MSDDVQRAKKNRIQYVDMVGTKLQVFEYYSRHFLFTITPGDKDSAQCHLSVTEEDMPKVIDLLKGMLDEKLPPA